MPQLRLRADTSLVRHVVFRSQAHRTTLDKLQFGIRLEGKFTHALQGLKQGSNIIVRGPYGGFVIDPSKHTDVILVAGGIGIAPFISMLRHAADHATDTPFTVLYSVSTQNDIPFLNELAHLSTTLPNLTVIIIVSHGDTDKLGGYTVVKGHIDDAVMKHAVGTSGASKTMFICGPPAFMNAMVSLGEPHGIANDRIITEAFKQGKHLQTGKVVSWPRNMYVLGATGIVLGAASLLVLDVIKSLPATPLKKSGAAAEQLPGDSTERDKQLDAIVNNLSARTTGTMSPATASAIADASTPEIVYSQGGTTNTMPAATPSAPVSTPTAPTPTPAPTPVCTTTQSGVTTCV